MNTTLRQMLLKALANGARRCENAASGGLVVRRLGCPAAWLSGDPAASGSRRVSVEVAERSYECELSESA
jgi:hypothetical protein